MEDSSGGREQQEAAGLCRERGRYTGAQRYECVPRLKTRLREAEDQADIEQIEDKRPMNKDMDAVYILSPLPHIVDCVMADFERRRYGRSFLIWTSGQTLSHQLDSRLKMVLIVLLRQSSRPISEVGLIILLWHESRLRNYES